MLRTPPYKSTSGSIFAMLFGAVAIVGVVGVAANTLIRGPMSSMAEVTRRTIAENSMIANARLAIMMAGTQTNGGDCDSDYYIEPIPYRNAGALPKPTGGGYLPTTVGASLNDPWGTEYGYCVWDHGPMTTTNNVAACGGSGALRLRGTNAKTQTTIAIISAGKDRTFQTTCNAFTDANADGIPDTPLVNKPAGSNDIVVAHTYAEVMAIGGDGLWRKKDAATADIDKDVEIRSSTDAVTARIERETGFGLFNSIYVDNIYKRTAARITVQDETIFNGNVGMGMIPGMRLDVNGQIRTTNSNPTIYMQDTDQASAVLHTNSNTFHILNAPANSPTWAINGSYWPLTINLLNDTTTFGGPVNLNEGGLTLYSGGLTMASSAGNINLSNNAVVGSAGTVLDAGGGWVRTYGNTGWYNGTYAGGMYMVDGTYVRTYNSRYLMAPAFYDENNTGYYVDPASSSQMEDIRVGVMYDRYNTGYYVVPRSTSNLNAVTAVSVSASNGSGYGVQGYSSSTYGVYGKSYSAGYGGVLGYDANGSIFGILGHANAYSLYGNGQLYVTGTSYIPFIYDVQNTGYYWDGNGTSSNNVIYAYAYYYHSDARKKKNIVTITPEEVDKLYQLRGVNFDWKESGKHDIGLIAQEVQKVFPELVSQLKEDELGVQYGNFVPLLIEAAKAQKAELEAYKNDLNTTIKKMNEQEVRIAKLESVMAGKSAMLESIATGKSAIPPGMKSQPAAPLPPQTTPQPLPQDNSGQIAQPKVDITTIKGAEDISICPKVVVPPCVLKQALTNAEEFSCRVEMSAYIHSAKIYSLCVKDNKDAFEKARAEYNNAIAKAAEKKFGLTGTDYNDIGYSQVLGLQHILNGSAIAPPPPAPPPAPQPETTEPPPAPAQDTAAPTPDTPPVGTLPPVTPPPAAEQPQAQQPDVMVPEAPIASQTQTNDRSASDKSPVKAEPLKINTIPVSSSESETYIKWLPYAGIAAGIAFILFGLVRGRKK